MFLRHMILSIGLAAGLVSSQATPVPPSQDPWYSAPPRYESTAPGTVLRLRAAPGNLTAVYGNSSSAWNVLYRTTDSNYQPAWAVTTVFVPKKRRGSDSLVSYQIPYNTADVDGSPSYRLNTPLFSSDISGSDIQTLLSYGWFVSVPDFEGPKASFFCAVSEGHATIDAIRAVKLLRESWSPSRDVRVAMWGYSGGSLATEFAAELQSQYAPELGISGMAIGGSPANASMVMQLGSGTPYAGVVAGGLLGQSKQHPDLNKTVMASLKRSGPYNASIFLSEGSKTADKLFPYFNGQNMSQYFTDGLAAVLRSPAYRHALNTDLVMGYHGVPQMPVFVYHAVNDEICPIAPVDALVSRYCGVDANILYRRNTVGDHVAEAVSNDAGALAWLRQIMAGNYTHTGCTIEDITIKVPGAST